ncbi:MAG: hypothetical protein KAS07_02615 [Candidatus Pacebacteria bacterium]|nr:hypothetical protein [Candidatus Paceibacterota bacterium]
MKAKSLLIISLLLFSFATGVLAQETKPSDADLPATALAEAGLTPDSVFYFLETITEGIGNLFTFGDVKKAERYASLADERLAEVQVMAEKGEPELAEKTLARYEKQLNNSIARAEKARSKDQSSEKVIEIMSKVGKVTHVHLDILAEVYEKVPEQAKPAVEKAMKTSLKGHEKAVEVLKEKDALGKVPEKVSLPADVPQEVRERIRMKVQQESMIEQVLQNPESPRDLCIRMGGPSEICEKIPLAGFDSFKDIENFCTEGGGPPEYCTTIESKCKEFGVTIPDECFRVISIATLEAYNSVELKTRPAPSMTEEEMRERRKIDEEVKINIETIEESNKPEDKFTGCEFNEMIFYFNPGCGYCEKVKNEGTILKMEELGVNVTQVDVQKGPVEHEFPGVPTFVVKEKVHVGYKTFDELSGLLGCF